MKFTIREAELHKNLFRDDKIRNNTGNNIRLFPFPAKDEALKDRDVLRDLEDFKGIAGACFRECSGYTHEQGFQKSAFVENVCETAGAAGNSNLKNIIEKIAFNERDQLVLFDQLVYPHIRNRSTDFHKTLNGIGRYLVALFFDEPEKNALSGLSRRDPENLFYKLILECLPDPTIGSITTEPYYPASPATKALFQTDLATLLSENELFIAGFHHLLQFYFFKHIADFAITLNSFFKEPVDTLFFSVKWEILQDYRLPMTHGWKLFEHHIASLFSHAMTLELLNYIDGLGDQPVVYQDIKNMAETLDPDSLNGLIDTINELIALYKSGVPEIGWEKFKPNLAKYEQNELEMRIVELFQTVEFQFIETKRDRAKTAYQNWMAYFTNINFGRRRGHLGRSLAISHEFLLLITRICVGNEPRIRLNKLWEELAIRGLNFDNSSRDHIVEYFEKVDLLEKKSDSGDAQYIRKFNQIIA